MTVTPFDYVETLADADELIEEFGQAVSLRKIVATGTAWEPTLTPTDTATFAAILDYDTRQIDGENILRTDRRALVAAGPLGAVVPAAPDSLVVNSVAVPIVAVRRVDPAGTVVMYDCQIRF